MPTMGIETMKAAGTRQPTESKGRAGDSAQPV